ncbi:MAG: hypothetical protein HGA38_02060 [Candidatus Moranbacteria bacterium]|nr:hypothetical protein [Candidatus Moranbacteria bacterium]NTW45541.1 hypothetical protein [Candidatus Moranbacteria bacterium]
MFSLLRFAIWTVGTVTVAGFLLGLAGYRLDWSRPEGNNGSCAASVSVCRDIAIRHGLEGFLADCRPDCLRLPKVIGKQD